MDKIKLKTDALCMDGALLFRKREALRREIAETEQRLANLRTRYRDAAGLYGLSVGHFEQACRSRGLL